MAGTIGAIDHALGLEKRRGFGAITATPSGIEASLGYRLWRTDAWEGALGAWAKNPWDEWNVRAGVRAEVRF